ncbi:MAG: CpaF family protein [Sulfobacillus thermosulfidooxidans]|uniref:Pilus assembly protein CpaF n=2 Tax=Sulfobacillus thermosulfidooxidans TaxID=28034 RepID=A0A1W1WPE8_SULTA|nr:ATPase, T2SS/T4P/T4SS family [Sulfobacillus thermosulfidooxidans]PSR20780.1 MAG: CpaF family protein [Sulfobacillus thermosulfidooxidans]PSR37259.1 MAG: CpaF family protein [Sulfobacillus thermosulfidooxidans]SMC08181.1 pilus assembly protein CpaF [Sulfobacillus thermosulfidooxidans DSM 9293]
MSHFANPLVQTFGGAAAEPNPLQDLGTASRTPGTASPFRPIDDHSTADATPSLFHTALLLLRDRYSSLIARIYQADRQAVRQAIADVVLSLHPSQDIAVQLTDALEAQLLGAGVLEPFMRDPTVSEIMVTGPYIFVDRHGRNEPALTLSSVDESIRLAQHLARHCQREYRDTEPLMDLTWPENGARINITHHRVAMTGPAITIRKHNMGVLLQLEELIRRGMLTEEVAHFLVRAFRARANGLIAGPTKSGKTALLRALAIEAIPPDERIIVLEDTEELHLPFHHQINLIGLARAVLPDEREHGIVSLLDLFRNALRQSPGRLIMGELRGPEAFDFIELGLTEKGGSLSTIHLRHPDYLVSRLYYIAQKSGLTLSRDLIQQTVYQAIDLIVYVHHDPTTGARRVSHVVETTEQGSVHVLFAHQGGHLVKVGEPSRKLQQLWEAA